VAVNRHLYSNLGFDPLKDLAPVSLAFRIEHLCAVSNALPARSVAELVALAKAKPGTLTFGSAGTGSMIHLAGVAHWWSPFRAIDASGLRCGAAQRGRGLAGAIVPLGDMLHPGDRRAVQLFLDRDVTHGGGGGRAMPVPLARPEPDHVAGANLLQRPALALRPATTCGDDQRLAERMRVPGGARAGLKGDEGAGDARDRAG
jgi:Tripartite tricarboxylate transporter family receptor